MDLRFGLLWFAWLGTRPVENSRSQAWTPAACKFGAPFRQTVSTRCK